MFKLTKKAGGLLMIFSASVILYELVIGFWFLVAGFDRFIFMTDIQSTLAGLFVLIWSTATIFYCGRRREGDEDED